MPIITYREALRQAIDEEMARDESVFIMGEEVAEYNGAYKVTQGLWDKYGSRRVIDTPITEESFTGAGVGAAMVGLRPIVEMMTFNFSLVAIDQIINNAAKMRYMSGGQFKVPMVIRGPNGPAEHLAAQHSQALQSFFAHVPGLKVVSPATPYDAKGMLKTAIRDDNPVIFLEGEMMYGWKGEVPDEEYTIPFGLAEIKREGADVSLITYGKPLQIVTEAADKLSEIGVNVEIVDIRSLRPLDEEGIYQSVRKTNRAVIIEESWPVASVGSYLGWLISKNCFDDLDAPVEMVASEDVSMPYNHKLELAAQPSTQKVVEAAKKVLYL